MSDYYCIAMHKHNAEVEHAVRLVVLLTYSYV